MMLQTDPNGYYHYKLRQLTEEPVICRAVVRQQDLRRLLIDVGKLLPTVKAIKAAVKSGDLAGAIMPPTHPYPRGRKNKKLNRAVAAWRTVFDTVYIQTHADGYLSARVANIDTAPITYEDVSWKNWANVMLARRIPARLDGQFMIGVDYKLMSGVVRLWQGDVLTLEYHNRDTALHLTQPHYRARLFAQEAKPARLR